MKLPDHWIKWNGQPVWFVERLREFLAEEQIAKVCDLIDQTCTSCWDDDCECQCWNDE